MYCMNLEVARQQNIIWHLYLQLFELCAGSSSLFGTKGRGRLYLLWNSRGKVSVKEKKKRVQLVLPSEQKMDRGENTVSLAQLYPTAGCEPVWVWLAMHFFFFAFVYL